MKRMHVQAAVDDLDKAIGFYSTPFAAQPDVVNFPRLRRASPA
jgi:hypothetical protein